MEFQYACTAQESLEIFWVVIASDLGCVLDLHLRKCININGKVRQLDLQLIDCDFTWARHCFTSAISCKLGISLFVLGKGTDIREPKATFQLRFINVRRSDRCNQCLLSDFGFGNLVFNSCNVTRRSILGDCRLICDPSRCRIIEGCLQFRQLITPHPCNGTIRRGGR